MNIAQVMMKIIEYQQNTVDHNYIDNEYRNQGPYDGYDL